jgi:hypothetical protein
MTNLQQNPPMPPEAQDRKAQLLKTWEALPLRGLRAFLDCLVEEDLVLLAQAVEEQEAAEAAR